jgi:gmma-aminobutyric acid receptor subunit gamma/cGMP-dependent protein kinase 2
MPTCFKQTTIVPVAKKAKVTCLYDYCPVVLAYVAMKGLSWLTSTPSSQTTWAHNSYRPNRSTDNTISIALHNALSHLDKRNTHVIMLFIDYSSAFNTIVPAKQGPWDGHLTLHLGLPDGPSPGGEGRQQPIGQADFQHRSPTGVRA